MKSIFLVFLSFCLLLSCSNNTKEDIDCALFDPAIPTFFINLIDKDGNNLIANETYTADDIIVENLGYGYTLTNVVFNDVDGIDHLIGITLLGT